MEFIIGLLLGNAVVLIAVQLFFSGRGFTTPKKAGITLRTTRGSWSRTLSWRQGVRFTIVPIPTVRGFKWKK